MRFVSLGLAAALTAAACPLTVSAETVRASADVSGKAGVGPGAPQTVVTAGSGTGETGSSGSNGSSETGDGTGTGSAGTQYDITDNNLDWGEIDALIHTYNATVVKNRNEWATDKRKSEDAQGVRDYLLDKADEYDGLYEQYQSTSAMTAANYKSSADSMRLQAESSVTDSQVIQLQYDLIEKQTAETARAAFLGYYQSQYELVYDTANRDYLERVYASTVNKQKLGMATEIDVLTAKENVDAAKAAILAADTNIGSYRNTLIVMCGWKYDTTDAVIGALPELDAAQVSSIDYEADKARAKAANYTLRMDEIKLANAKSGSYTTLVVEQNENQLNDDTQSFGISFKAAYDSLVNAGTAYTNAVNDKAVADRNLNTAVNELAQGVISNIEYEGTKNAQAKAEYAERTAYIGLIEAKAAYDAALSGNL